MKRKDVPTKSKVFFRIKNRLRSIKIKQNWIVWSMSWYEQFEKIEESQETCKEYVFIICKRSRIKTEWERNSNKIVMPMKVLGLTV